MNTYSSAQRFLSLNQALGTMSHTMYGHRLPCPSSPVGWSGSVMWSYTIGFPRAMTKSFLFFWLLPTMTIQEKSHTFIPNMRDVYEKSFRWSPFSTLRKMIIIYQIRKVNHRVLISQNWFSSSGLAISQHLSIGLIVIFFGELAWPYDYLLFIESFFELA